MIMYTKTQDKQAIKVFISYSHKDEKLLFQLHNHLDALERQRLITIRHDRGITAGQEWKSIIEKNITDADIILFLVSPDFISSEYCYDVELQLAMKRHENNEARVIPIILRPVDWQNTPIGNLQSLPKDGKPIINWKNRDEAFLDITNGVRLVAQELINSTNEKSIHYAKGTEHTIIKKKIKWVLVLSATIDEIDKPKAEAIVEHLRKLSRDSDLTLLKIESGSVRIYFEGDEDGFERIKSIFKSQNLTNICEFEVIEIRLEETMSPTNSVAEYENRLITNIQRGNSEAVNELISRYIDRIIKIIKIRIGKYDKEDWQDVVSSVISALLDKVRQGQIKAEKLPAYIFGLIRIKIREYQVNYTEQYRYCKIEPELLEEEFLLENVKKEKMLKAIEEAIDNLDSEHKQILYLRYSDKLTVKQIAEKLQLTNNQVYTRIQYARKLLREEMKRIGFDF